MNILQRAFTYALSSLIGAILGGYVVGETFIRKIEENKSHPDSTTGFDNEDDLNITPDRMMDPFVFREEDLEEALQQIGQFIQAGPGSKAARVIEFKHKLKILNSKYPDHYTDNLLDVHLQSIEESERNGEGYNLVFQTMNNIGSEIDDNIVPKIKNENNSSRS